MINLGKRIFRKVRAALIRLPADTDNVAHNRALWNRYAIGWNKETIGLQQNEKNDNDFRCSIRHLGDEWGSPSHVDDILEDFLFPYLIQTAKAIEIGVGGGRIADKVAPRVEALTCCDISSEMLSRAQKDLARHKNISYRLLEQPVLPSPDDSIDIVYSFDVFVHLDLHTIWRYFKEISRTLKPGGFAFLHTSNLRAPGGWEEFSSQDAYSVIGHYFITPDTIALLSEHSGLEIVKASEPSSNNFYLNRDYLFVVRKPVLES
jgi:SAM-dependent methyltransferase